MLEQPSTILSKRGSPELLPLQIPAGPAVGSRQLIIVGKTWADGVAESA